MRRITNSDLGSKIIVRDEDGCCVPCMVVGWNDKGKTVIVRFLSDTCPMTEMVFKSEQCFRIKSILNVYTTVDGQTVIMKDGNIL